MPDFETEAMAEITPTLLARATGSTGSNPIQDSSARGIIAAIIIEGLNLLATKTDLLETGEVGDFAALVVLVAFVLGGAWDKFLKGRVLSS